MRHRGDEAVLSALMAGKPVVVCAEGGGYRSVAVVGMLEALAKIPHPAKAHVGVSGGACAQAGFLSGESAVTFEVYEKLAREGCLTWKFVWPYGWQIQFDQEKLIRILEENLNIPNIRDHASAYGVSVLTYETGEQRLLDGKENTLEKISATTSIAGTCQPVSVGGVLHVDGMNIQIGPAIRKFWARDVIVLRSRRRWWWEEACYPWLAHASLSQVPPLLRNAIAVAEARFENEMRRLRECTRIRYLEIEPCEDDPFIWPWTSDVELLKKMRDNARNHLLRLMDKAAAH